MRSTISAAYLKRYMDVTRGLDGSGILPLTGAQRRFLLVQRVDPRRRPDIVPLFFAFPRGTVDLTRLRSAAEYVCAAHPVLRSGPLTIQGTPARVLRTPAATVRRVDPERGEDPSAALRRTLFDWEAEGPPLRLIVVADADREILALALEHAVCDEQSLGRVVGDLTAAYRERLGADGVGARQRADDTGAYQAAVYAQLRAESGASSPAALAHWAGRLRGMRPPPLPERAPASAGGYGVLTRRLPLGIGDTRGRAFPALLAAVAGAAPALHGGAGTNPVLGYPWGGRAPAASTVVGSFLNTVAFPVPASGGPDEVTEAWWHDLDHADTPFDEVVRLARRVGTPWSGALDGTLTLEDLSWRPPLELDSVAGHEVHVDGRPPRAPFAVSASYGTDLLVRLVWDRSVIDDAAAEPAFDLLVASLREHLLGPPALPPAASSLAR